MLSVDLCRGQSVVFGLNFMCLSAITAAGKQWLRAPPYSGKGAAPPWIGKTQKKLYVRKSTQHAQYITKLQCKYIVVAGTIGSWTPCFPFGRYSKPPDRYGPSPYKKHVTSPSKQYWIQSSPQGQFTHPQLQHGTRGVTVLLGRMSPHHIIARVLL